MQRIRVVAVDLSCCRSSVLSSSLEPKGWSKAYLLPHQPVAEQHSFIPHGIFASSLYSPHMAVASQFEVQPVPQKSGP